MKTAFHSVLLAGFIHANGAVAEPCVTATFDRPVPGASDVVTRQVDVPSPQFPGLWQEGNLDGFFYALYANGEGLLQPSRTSETWQISIRCDDSAARCDLDEVGDPSPEAVKTAQFLGECLLQSDPTDAVVVEATTETEPSPEALPCGLEAIPTGGIGITLQRLINAAGGDPGPIDGFPGELTRTALVGILGDEALSMDDATAVAALDALLCQSQ